MGRASESEQTGSVGVSEATGKFGRIGFGFAEITRHDNGTDVFLMARDRRLWDLGLTMAAQIKGGPSWFKEPVRDAAGAVVGWWFRDDNGEHLQDWVDHALPHLLVMHNLEEDISYWVLVDNDAIISTGKGAKVLVPLTQRVDEHSRDALIAIASSVRVAPRWEGSAWAGATSLSQRDLVRYALIAPRLVAPHPNAGIREPLTAAQAIAMAAQVRDMEIREAVDNGNLRPLDELRRATDPGWRLFAAMLGRVRTGDAEELAQVHRGIEKSPMRAAAAASGAACLLEEGRADEAIRILEAELAQDYALPVDHAWLVVQLARACGEAGQYERARALAASFQALSVTHAEDLTATALAGAGVGILFRLSDWGSVDLENVIASSDTIVGWWRSQTRGWALGAAVAETFRTWSRDTSTRFANSDPANDQLVAAMLNATLIGDHGAWAALMQVHGMNVLSRTGRDSEPAAVKAAVDALRLGGDVKGIEKAVRRVVVDGPASAVAELADSLDLDAMTPTSVGATLTLLREAGAALSPGAAERISAWLLGVLEEPKHFVATTRPSFLLRQTLVETLSGVMQGAASTSTHEAIADAFLSRDAVTDELEARAWAGVLVRLADAAWTDARVSTARARLSDNERLRRALQQVARPRDPLARDELLAEIRRGSPEALAAWRTLHDLPADAAAEALEGLARLLEERARDASPGVTYGYTYDIGALLAQMSAVYPDAARWEELTQYLEHPSVADGNRSGPLGQLATHWAEVPLEFRNRLASVAAAVVSASSDASWSGAAAFMGGGDVRGSAAAIAEFHAANNGDLTPGTLKLLEGSLSERRWAARVMWHVGEGSTALATGLLLSLVHDADPVVRATAVIGLVRFVRAGQINDVILGAIDTAAREDALRVPRALAESLAAKPAAATQSPTEDDLLAGVRTYLAGHPRWVIARNFTAATSD